jgi:hypothetical protein
VQRLDYAPSGKCAASRVDADAAGVRRQAAGLNARDINPRHASG